MFLYLYFFGCWKPEAITILYIRTLLGLECKHAPFAERKLKRRSECAIRRQRNGQNSLKASEKYMCYVAFVEMERQKKVYIESKCISGNATGLEMREQYPLGKVDRSRAWRLWHTQFRSHTIVCDGLIYFVILLYFLFSIGAPIFFLEYFLVLTSSSSSSSIYTYTLFYLCYISDIFCFSPGSWKENVTLFSVRCCWCCCCCCRRGQVLRCRCGTRYSFLSIFPFSFACLLPVAAVRTGNSYSLAAPHKQSINFIYIIGYIYLNPINKIDRFVYNPRALHHEFSLPNYRKTSSIYCALIRDRFEKRTIIHRNGKRINIACICT